MIDRYQVVHQNFVDRINRSDLPEIKAASLAQLSEMHPARWIELFESQVLSRQLDRIAKKLQAQGEGFYTIGSSGHEGMAAVAAAFRLDDMAFLHYRDAAFQIQRARLLPGQTPAWDMLLSFCASADDPYLSRPRRVPLPRICPKPWAPLTASVLHVDILLKIRRCLMMAWLFVVLAMPPPIIPRPRAQSMLPAGQPIRTSRCPSYLSVKITVSAFPHKHPEDGSKQDSLLARG